MKNRKHHKPFSKSILGKTRREIRRETIARKMEWLA